MNTGAISVFQTAMGIMLTIGLMDHVIVTPTCRLSLDVMPG